MQDATGSSASGNGAGYAGQESVQTSDPAKGATYQPEDVRAKAEESYNAHRRLKVKLSEGTISVSGSLDDRLEDLDHEERDLAIELKSEHPLVKRLYRVLAEYNLITINSEKEAGKVVASSQEAVTELESIVKEVNNELYGRDYDANRLNSLGGLYLQRKEMVMRRIALKDAIKGEKVVIKDLEVLKDLLQGNVKHTDPERMPSLYEEIYGNKSKIDECRKDLVKYESDFTRTKNEIRALNEQVETKEAVARIAQDVINEAMVITSYFPERSTSREYLHDIPILAEHLREKLGKYVEFMEKRRKIDEKQEEVLARQVTSIPSLGDRLPKGGIDKKSPLAELQIRRERISDDVAQDIEKMEENPFYDIQ